MCFIPSKKWTLIGLLQSLTLFSWAQFAGPVGHFSSTSIHKDSAVFVAWANSCTAERGWLDSSDTLQGKVTSGNENDALNMADEFGTLSLGDGGSAILQFHQAIFNGPGPDFAVFENAFNDFFLELAFVEVSSDGIHFFRFPATSNTPNDAQIGPFDELGDATKIHNLAGKYRSGYATPFDLEELNGTPNLDLNAVTHIKIIDVVGSISNSWASEDHLGNPVNDPFPTPFPSGGFDLDAVGAMYVTGINQLPENQIQSAFLYPNPAENGIQLSLSNLQNIEWVVRDIYGKIVLVSSSSFLEIEGLAPGYYSAEIRINNEFTILRNFQKI